MKKYSGFTLLEILLYVVIGGLTLVIASFAFIQITRLATSFRVNNELNQNGAAITEQIQNLINNADTIISPKADGAANNTLSLRKDNTDITITQSTTNIAVSYSNGDPSYNLNPTGILVSNTPSPTLSFQQINTKDNIENAGLSQTIKLKFTLRYNKPTFSGFEYDATKDFETTLSLSKKTSSFQPILNSYPTGANGVAYGLRKLAGFNTNTNALSSAYNGAAIRVRRDTGLDQNEMDIGFTSKGDLDTVALQNFVGYQNFLTYSEDITAATPTALATGGTITSFVGNGTNGENGATYFVHTFTNVGNSTFTPTTNISNVEYLVVGGGGGGARGIGTSGGGGGAGGYRSSVIGEPSGGGASAESRINLTPQAYSVVVGGGGGGGAGVTQPFSGQAGAPGGDSSFAGIVALGGGPGHTYSNAVDGYGSGGGSSAAISYGGAGTTGQGYDGGGDASGDWAAGGGGGAGGIGQNTVGSGGTATGGPGGIGLTSSITGTATGRAGGGGGSRYNSGSGEGTASHGGGAGGHGGSDAANGTINTGGGGGGSSNNRISGNGGSGIVIIRYKVNSQPISSIWTLNNVTTISDSGTSNSEYRYYKWVITGIRSTSLVQVSEFNLINDNVNITMPIPSNPGGSNPSYETPAQLVDNNVNTKWLDFNGLNSTLIFDMGTTVKTTGYRWYTANDAIERDPISWSLSGSSDGVNYTTLHTVTNATIPTSRFTLAGTWTYNAPSSVSTTAPDGTNTAEKVNLSAGNNNKSISKNTNLTSGSIYTDSYYVKAKDHNNDGNFNNDDNFVQIAPDINFFPTNITTPTAYQNYNLRNNGILANKSNDIVENQSKIEKVGNNGWYRISLSYKAERSNSGGMVLSILNADIQARAPVINITTATDSIFVWGGMRHLNNSLTSPPKTYQKTLANANTGDGYITTWYDQSGNKNNAIQATPAAQPKIVDGVTGIVYMNSKPAIRFDGSDDQLSNTSFNNATNSTAFFIASRGANNQSLANNQSFMARSTNYATLGSNDLFNTYYLNKSNTAAGTGADPKNTLNLYTAIRTSTINSALNIGAGSAGNFLNGYISELIIYDGNKLADRTTIENNLRDYYATQ